MVVRCVFAMAVAAICAAEVRIDVSLSSMQGDFGEQGEMVCGQCVPYTEGVVPVSVDDVVYWGVDDEIAPNWALFESWLRSGNINVVRWDVPVWIGGKFQCAEWSSIVQCGGGIVMYPNGTRIAEPCSDSHHVLCVCDDNNLVATFVQGLEHLCTIQDKHDIYCAQQMAAPTIMTYAEIPPSNVVFGGIYSFIARLLNGTYMSWGAIPSARLPDTPDGSPIVEFGATTQSITMRTREGNVYSIGDNVGGVIFGDGEEYGFYDIDQWHAALVPKASRLVSGMASSCIITAVNSSVWCWGVNNVGLRGDMSDPESINPFPTKVPLPFAPTAICGKGFHICVTRWDEYGVWCWGMNFQGEGGRASSSDSFEPVRAIHFDRVVGESKRLICGFGFTCLLLRNNSYACTGRIEYTTTPYPAVTGYAEIFDRLDGISNLDRGGINTVCGIAANNTVQCAGAVSTFPTTTKMVAISPGSLCISHDTYSPYVCGISGGKLVCVGGEVPDRSNHNLVNVEFHSNISRIFCNSFYVSIEFDTMEMIVYSPYANTVFDEYNFTLPSPIRTVVDDPDASSMMYLCEDNVTYIKFYDNAATPIPAELNTSFAGYGTHLHLTSYAYFVCAVNVSHPRIVSVREPRGTFYQEYELDDEIEVLQCGPSGMVAWIYKNEGMFDVKPTNPFSGIVDRALDIALNSISVCALGLDRVIHCFQKDDEESWFEIETSVELSLPKMTRIVAGYGYICAEGEIGDVWCMHQYPDYIEGAGPIGTNPLRVNFGPPL